MRPGTVLYAFTVLCFCVAGRVFPPFCRPALAQQTGEYSQEDLEKLASPDNQGETSGNTLKNITVKGNSRAGFDVPSGGLVLHTAAGTIRIESDRTGSTAKTAPPPPAPETASKLLPYITAVTFAAGIYLVVYLASLVFPGLRRRTEKNVLVFEDEGRRQAVYPITRVLGQGGMGVVYEAYDRVLDRKVAVKKMLEESRGSISDRESFIREAKTVAKLHHPAIVDIYSIVEQGDDIYLVFEFVDGKTLAELLKKQGRFSLAETKKILKPVCDALEFAHGHNVIHRDLKPANVMITELGFVKVMDFGLASQAKNLVVKPGPQEVRTQLATSIAGTPFYMSPEAERGMICKESDIYSLGVMAFEMLTGRVPFPDPRDAQAKTGGNYTKPSAIVTELTAGLDSFISDMLRPDPGQRPHSAEEVWRRLAAVG